MAGMDDDVLSPAALAPGALRRARKIAALAAEIAALRNIMATVDNRLDSLEHEMVLLAKPRHHALTRDALTILRNAPEPMPLRALTLALMEARSLDASDTRLTRPMTERMRLLLWRQEAAGVVRKAKGKGSEERQVWGIAG